MVIIVDKSTLLLPKPESTHIMYFGLETIGNCVCCNTIRRGNSYRTRYCIYYETMHDFIPIRVCGVWSSPVSLNKLVPLWSSGPVSLISWTTFPSSYNAMWELPAL
jgi:hypothetical protein